MSNNKIMSSWLLGKGVFNPDASFIGKIIAVRAEAPDKPTLLTQIASNSALEIGWDRVAGGRDILILKPGFVAANAKKVFLPLTEAAKQGWDVGTISTTKAPQPGDAPVCPTCGKKAEWIGEYGRWYCRNERKYL